MPGVEDADDKKAWVLVTPLEDDVVKEVADELSVINAGGGCTSRYGTRTMYQYVWKHKDRLGINKNNKSFFVLMDSGIWWRRSIMIFPSHR